MTQTPSVPLRRPGAGLWPLRKVMALAWAMASSRLAYASETLLKMGFMSVVLFTISSLWRVVGRHQDIESMTGFNAVELVWYLAFTQLMFSTGVPLTVDAMELDREVKTGDIAYRLCRPVPYLLSHLAEYLGYRFTNLLVLVLPVISVAYLLTGAPSLRASAALAAIASALTAMVLDGIFSTTLSLTAFWIEDTYGLHLLYRRFVLMVGGVLVPLEAFPDWLRTLAHVLPFQALMYGPAHLFFQPDASGLWALWRTQLTYGLLGLVPLMLLYRAGIKRVSANGG